MSRRRRGWSRHAAGGLQGGDVGRVSRGQGRRWVPSQVGNAGSPPGGKNVGGSLVEVSAPGSEKQEGLWN